MKKRILAAFMMIVMLMSTMGSVAFAAETEAPEFGLGCYEAEEGTVIVFSVLSGQLTEFEVSLELVDTPMEYEFAFNPDFEAFAKSNDGVLQSGVQFDTGNAVVGGIFAEPVEYTGEFAAVLCKGGIPNGTPINFYVNGELFEEYEYVQAQYGDVDGNGEIEANDALMTLKAVVRLITLDNLQTVCADVDGNGEVEANDALLILRYVVKLIEAFPGEAPR